MILVVGLGNPGRKHTRNRHNIGYMAADEIVRRHGFGPWRSKFQAQISEGRLGGQKAVVMKPTTYMNNSGQAVGEAARFHKLDLDDIVVIHDELDLSPGRFKVKTGGGNGGHNGLRSITQHLGADYHRVRIGIGHPGHKDQVARYVLHDFARADSDWIDPLVSSIAEHFDLLAESETSKFSNAVHLDLQPPANGKTPADRPAKSVVPEPPKAPVSALADGLARLFGRKGA